jgi:hypothetical protein
MAGEIGHVVYGARVLTYLGKQVQYPAYWVGTLFPDIRHLGATTRHRTHPPEVSLQSVVGKNDFQTGVRVHAWVDTLREQFLRESAIKERLPWHPFVPHALKLFEDEMLYDRFDDWDSIQTVLGKVYDDELFYVGDKEVVWRWHQILQNYFKQAPTDATRSALSQAIGLSEQSAHEINRVVSTLRSQRVTTEIITAFLHHLEHILS